MPRDDADDEFCAYVAGRSGALLRTAYLLTGDHQLAEDLVQTALTKTYLAWGRIKDPSAVDAYVRRTMVTTQTSWWRRRWSGERPAAELPDTAYDVDFAAGDEHDRMWAHLQSLPARQRAVVVLRFYEDLTEAQTAAVLGCSTGTVKSQAHRAIATLRRRLEEERDRELTTGGAP